MVDTDTKLFLWGGLDLKTFENRDDLFMIEELPRFRRGSAVPHFDVTWIQTLESQTVSRCGLDIPHQTGSVPSGT